MCGLLEGVGGVLGALFARGRMVSLLVIGFAVGMLSAFVNNTTVVAIMLPILVRSAAEAGESPSKVLMPLAFASVLGGCCTLIGTSTNLIVSSVM